MSCQIELIVTIGVHECQTDHHVLIIGSKVGVYSQISHLAVTMRIVSIDCPNENGG